MFSLLKAQEARVPYYTSLCKRKTLNVSLKVYGKRCSLDVVVDSTGLKVYGAGEWKVYKHERANAEPGVNPTLRQTLEPNRSSPRK